MKKTVFVLSAISLTTLLSLLPSLVLAKSSASASVKDFNYTLTDLNPWDGIAPSLEVDRHRTDFDYSFVSGYASDFSTGNTPGFYNTGDHYTSKTLGAFSPVSGTGVTDSSVMSATVGKDSLSAQGSAEGHDDARYTYFDATANPTAGYTYFTLSPQTSLTFTGNQSLTATSSVNSSIGDEFASASRFLYGFAHDDAGAEQSFGGFSALYSINGSQILNTYDFQNGNSTYDDAFVGTSLSSAFNHTITNTSDNAITGYLYSYVSVSGTSYASTSPVPEPSTYAMLLAGLCLITCASRRNTNT